MVSVSESVLRFSLAFALEGGSGARWPLMKAHRGQRLRRQRGRRQRTHLPAARRPGHGRRRTLRTRAAVTRVKRRPEPRS